MGEANLSSLHAISIKQTDKGGHLNSVPSNINEVSLASRNFTYRMLFLLREESQELQTLSGNFQMARLET